MSFNPHPARRPDATPSATWSPGRPAAVSILIRPEGRMQHVEVGAARHSPGYVSILIRPEGRMQPPTSGRTCSRCGFNPHPARRPDATRMPGGTMVMRFRFQSSSGQKAGCNSRLVPSLTSKARVSILIRPEGRMQPRGNAIDNAEHSRFNPHPARRPDATHGCGDALWRPGCFNPHPARRPDATRVAVNSWTPLTAGFNPHPARRPDATIRGRGRLAGQRPVSILIRPEGRMQRLRKCATLILVIVSILIRPEGRMQPVPDALRQAAVRFQSSSGQKAGCNHRLRRKRHALKGFNPHPARRPDATISNTLRAHSLTLVSILIRPEGRMQLRPQGRCRHRRYVSILIRPEGRMQPAMVATARLRGLQFQSSSGQKAGCNITEPRR